MKNGVELEQLLKQNGRDILEMVKKRDDGPEIIGLIWAASK